VWSALLEFVISSRTHGSPTGITTGDNPSVSSGPALAIGWEYDPNDLELDVDRYESLRGDRRREKEMALSRHMREAILKFECGCSMSELARSVREINLIKANRRQTVNNLKYTSTEERFEAMKRSLSKFFCAKRSVDMELNELWAKTEKAPFKQIATST